MSTRQAAYSRKWYAKNRDLQRERVNAQRRAKRDYIRQLKIDGECVDCGEDDWRTLDFDHVRGDKKFDISQATALGAGWERLKAEVAKCELRCANCHRKRTHMLLSLGG